MFHDRSLKTAHTSAMDLALVYKLNHYAAALLWRVRDAEKMGHQILNREYLGSQFNKRQWMLATKGSRPMDGRKVLDKAAAPDGLEFYGIIVCDKQRDCEGRTKTVWLIGSVAADEIEAKMKERDEYLSQQQGDDDVIETDHDFDEHEPEAQTECAEPAQGPTETRKEFMKRAVRYVRIRDQAKNNRLLEEYGEKALRLGKAFSDNEWLESMGLTRSVHHTPLNISSKKACIARLACPEYADHLERKEWEANNAF